MEINDDDDVSTVEDIASDTNLGTEPGTNNNNNSNLETNMETRGRQGFRFEVGIGSNVFNGEYIFIVVD